MNDQLFDIQAEKALLGAILIAEQIPDEVSAKISPLDFHLERHEKIYAAAKKLQSESGRVDFVTLVAALRNNGLLDEIGGAGYLAEITNSCPSHVGIYNYADIVHELGERRRYVRVAERVARAAMEDRPVDEIAKIIREAEKDESSSDWDFQFIPHNDLLSPPTPVDWIVKDYIARGSLSIWYGAPGSKKSYILADLSVSAAAGTPWLQSQNIETATLKNGIETQESRILWIDLDNGRRVTRNRFSALLKGHNAPPDNLFPLSMPSPWPFMDRDEPADHLFRTITSNHIDLVIIDNLGHITGDVDENSAEMAKVMSRLRRIVDATNAAIIVIHHSRKGGANGQRVADALRGSSAVEAALDYAFYIEKDEENPDIATIKPAKIREGRWPKPITIMGHFNQDDATLRSVSFTIAPSEASFSRYDAILCAILNAVKEKGSDSTRAVITHVTEHWDYDDKSLSSGTIHKYITKAKTSGFIITKKKEGSQKKTIHLTRQGLDHLEIGCNFIL